MRIFFLILAVIALASGLILLIFISPGEARKANRIGSLKEADLATFQALAPGQDVVVTGVLTGNAELDYGLVAYHRYRWRISTDSDDKEVGGWRPDMLMAPALTISMPGGQVTTTAMDLPSLGGKYHAYEAGSGGRMVSGKPEGSTRWTGFKNGDMVTVVGKKDTSGQITPEILWAGSLQDIIKSFGLDAEAHRSFGWCLTVPALLILLAVLWPYTQVLLRRKS